MMVLFSIDSDDSTPRYGTRTVMALLAAIVLASAVPAAADIYSYVDDKGVLHFTNVPTSPKYRVVIKQRRQSRAGVADTARYDGLISQAARHHGLSFPLLKAIIKAESGFNPRAVSKKGALGLMQIMPENLRLLRVYDPFDPWQNIMGGARYFKAMLQRFDGSVSLALAAYNAGPKAVESYQQIPPYRETRNYVRKVMAYYRIFRQA